MGKIYFTSDTHFCHNKDFCYEPRGFKTIEEMNEKIFNNWNSIVTDEDDIYHLGDIMLNDDTQGMMYLENLKGKIHIIRGNHDTDTRVEKYKQLNNIVEITYATIIKYGKAHLYLCHYPTLTANYDDDKPWHKNLVNLFGHTHQQENFYNNNPYMYHVGVDSHNCKPIEIEEILEEIRQKKIELNNERMKKTELPD